MTDQDSAGSEQESKQERAEGVERMLTGEPPPKEPPQQDPEGSESAPGADDAGDSMQRGGEDVAEEDEPGRFDMGTQGPTDRPVGGSTPRDFTGVAPEDRGPDSPEAGTGVQGN